jgi:hypothetical protein
MAQVVENMSRKCTLASDPSITKKKKKKERKKERKIKKKKNSFDGCINLT